MRKVIAGLFLVLCLVVSTVFANNATNVEGTDETPIQPADLKATDITLDQAHDIIREFTGNPELKIKKMYQDLDDYRYSSIDNADAQFWIDAHTHRVTLADLYPFRKLAVKPGMNKISLDEAYVIAENFAKSRCPQFWNTTDETGVNLWIKRTDTFGDYENHDIIWNDEYYYPDKNTPGHITITGLKYISISVAPSGEIYSYGEDLTPRDESVSLKPDLTEDQAWEIAKKRFLEHHGTVTDADIVCSGLQLKLRNDRQYLTWVFEVIYERVWIDAHDGQVVLYDDGCF